MTRFATRMGSTGAMVLAAVTAASPADVNLTPLGTATQSSTGWGGFPERAIDGNIDGAFGAGSVTHTDPRDPSPWWEVDLGDMYALSRVILWNRTDCCAERLTNFRALVRDDAGEEIHGEHFFPDGVGYPAPGRPFEIPLEAGTEGARVRIEIAGPSAAGPRVLALAEVQVFGNAPDSSPKIVRQPEGRRVAAGGSVTLSVDAIGADPLRYRWRRDDEDIPGATDRELPLDPVERGDAGIYEVIVSNDKGSATSEPMELIVTAGNLAPAGRAEQSSTGWGGAASRAIDGNPDGLWNRGSVTHTDPNDPSPWWEVALAVDSMIEEIVIWNRMDCCAGRLSNFRVLVLDRDREVVFSEAFFTDGFDYPIPGEPFEIFLPAGTKGRFVRIEILGPNAEGLKVLSLAEVEVLGEALEPPPDPNLARRGTARQSSTYDGYPARLAVDGDLDTFTHTEVGTALPSTWEVDLGAMFDIDRIFIHNRRDCCGSRLRDIRVVIADAAGDAVFESGLLNPENALGTYPSGPARLAIDLIEETGGSVAGRTVRVVRTPDPDLSGSGGLGSGEEPDVLSLAEVEVFGPAGCPVEGDTHCRGFVVEGPADGRPGMYALTAAARDDSGDVPIYTFMAERSPDPPIVVGPRFPPTAAIRLLRGAWTLSVRVDDGEGCTDEAADAICSEEIVVSVDPDQVAVNGVATQSSTAWGGDASRAIDGMTDGTYSLGSVTHTDPNDRAPWWEVDLGRTHDLDRIVLWNRADDCAGCPERLSNFLVSVLDEGREEVHAEEFFTDGLGFPPPGEPFEIDLAPETAGRFVRIEILGPNAEGLKVLSLAEVEVFRVREAPAVRFRRGDANADGRLDLGDAIFTLNYLFASGNPPACASAADVEDSGNLTIGDAVYLLNYQFASGPAPAEPFAECGVDPTPDALPCAGFPACGTER